MGRGLEDAPPCEVEEGPLGEFLRLFPCRKRIRDGWMVHCPGHEDREPSLSIRRTGGRILIYCHAGCPSERVLEALHLSYEALFIDGGKREMQQPPNPPHHPVEYLYTDERGNHLFTVVRRPDKTFRQYHLVGGERVWSINGVRRVLFRLPRICEAKERGKCILIVEGEKDVLTAERMGFYATTNPGGALKWLPEYTETLRGCHCVVIPDNDKPGREHAYRVVQELLPAARSVRLLDLPVSRPHEDLTDWCVSYGGTKERLVELMRSSRVVSGAPANNIAFRKALLQSLRNVHRGASNPFVPDDEVMSILFRELANLLGTGWKDSERETPGVDTREEKK